jgi:hypothetical protein
MTQKLALACVTLALLALPATHADDRPDAQQLAERLVPQLIQQLGSKSFKEREAAARRWGHSGMNHSQLFIEDFDGTSLRTPA